MENKINQSIQQTTEIKNYIQKLFDKFDEFEKIDYNVLSTQDKIKLNNAIAYTYATLYYCLCKLNDNQENTRYVTKELERIRNAFNKVKKQLQQN